MTKLIENVELSDEDEPFYLLEQDWPVRSHAAWLVPELKQLQPLKATLREDETRILRVVRSLVAQLQGDVTAPVALGRFIATVADERPEDKPVLRGLASAAVAHGVNFSAELSDLKPRRGFNPPQQVMAATLAELGVIAPGELVDWQQVIGDAAKPGSYPKKWNSKQEQIAESNPALFLFWVGASLPLGLDLVRQHLDAERDDETFARLAKGAVRTLGTWMRRHPIHPTSYEAVEGDFQDQAALLLSLVVKRGMASSDLHGNSFWADSVMRLWVMAYSARESESPVEMRDVAIELAKREIGRIRGRVKTLDAERAEATLDRESDLIEAATHILFATGGVWSGMKPLLLIVRASPTPLFALDLSWWDDVGKPPRPRGATAVAQRLMFGFQAFARFEHDDNLERLRSELMGFCLERLKSAKGTDVPVEPSETWRLAYVRAATELGANAGTKAHKILHHARKNDPAPDVCAAAEKAYPSVRHASALPAGMSPRRAVLAALWWLRQAHMLELGMPVDDIGARLTRRDEVRFTTPKFSGD